MIDLQSVGQFFISNGNSVIYHFRGKKLNFEDYILAIVSGVLLLQQGHLLLHGNSFMWMGQHIALCGDSHTGKSSLAAQFHKAGAQFFSDEIICFDKKTNSALPGYPFLRLWNQDLDFNQFDPQFISKLWNNENKYKLDTSNQRHTENHLIDTLIYFEIDINLDHPKIEELHGLNKTQIFWKSYYHPALIRAMNLEAIFHKQSLNILQNLRVFKLSRSHKTDSRKECFDLVKNTIN